MTAWIDAPTTVPPMMQAVTMRRFGAPDVLELESVTTPVPAPGEALIRVSAVSVGRLLDLVARSGNHPYATFTFPHILGAECAGVVASVGSPVDRELIGKRVAVFPLVFPDQPDELTQAGFPELSPQTQLIGTHRQGAYAEYVAVPARNVRIVPEGLDPAGAVALVVAGAVAMNQFVKAGGVRAGTRVLVQGASSALGSTTALLAKHLGARVVVSSRSDAKRARLRGLGFEHALDPTADDFVAQVQTVFEGRGAQIVVDNLAAPAIWKTGLDTLAPGGALVTSGAFLSDEVPVNPRRLYSHGQRVVGVRTGNLASLDALWHEVEDGFRSVVDRTFTLGDAAAAHTYVEGDANIGRVALVVGGSA